MEALAQCSSHSLGPANQMFGLLIQTVLSAACNISPPDMWPEDFGPTAIKEGLKEYDFIVVGAGSAGSVMANRLSENTDWNVLLLEAGGDPPIESEIPLLFATLQHTKHDWEYYTEPGKTGGLGTKNGNFWPRGKMFGGCSASNAMLYLRGNSRDYETWSNLGNDGWNWDAVLEYFKKSEDNKLEAVVNDSKQHSKGGYLKVGHFEDSARDVRNMIDEMFGDLGYPPLPYSTGERLGFFRAMTTQDGGTRCSAAKAFLTPIRTRSNLHVIKYAHVTKILFKEPNVVSGVSFKIEGHDAILTATTKKEVILSAGAINTPQILMLSGIGPKAHLVEHNITVRHDLPVGSNLQDHLIVFVPMVFQKSTSVPYAQLVFPDEKWFKYVTNRTGPLATINLSDQMGFVSTVGDPEFSDMQIHMLFVEKDDPSLTQWLSKSNMDEEVIRSTVENTATSRSIIFMLTLLNPKSSGSIELKSTNPFDAPKITANYLAEQEDVDTVVRAIRFLQRLKKSPTFIENEGEFSMFKFSKCDELADDSDAYLECYARYASSTLYHPSGTAKMGPNSDFTAVVDSRLRVHGVKRLRVVDASIMPNIVSGNTNAPTIMIGEKAADMVKEDWATDVVRSTGRKDEKTEL